MATPNIYKSQYLTIEATSSGNITITLGSNLTTTDLASFSYSKDKTNWTTWTNDQQGTTITVAMNSGDKLYLKGSGQRYKHTLNTAGKTFSTTCDAKIYGNVMSLLYGDNFENADTVYSYSFNNLFYYCKKITIDNLVLAATTLGIYCYRGMFQECTSLTTAPALPATTLANSCYNYMFYGCTALTTAPALPATTLAQQCYSNMFNGCTNLSKIKMLATDISAPKCLYNWVKNVASTGTFTKAAEMTTLSTGNSGIPSGWTVKNYNPNTYSGTVYDFGDIVPGYVSYTYTPKIWYDQSKSVINGTADILNELGISESLILGETEDDLWTYEEILEEICKYFNLHIVQLGYDFYLFDWETSKSGNSVTWVNIFDFTETKNSTYATLNVAKKDYADDSTQISLGDCYNQLVLTDKVEKFEDVILSPFDDDNLYDICSPQLYLTEVFATGEGTRAADTFIKMIRYDVVGTTYNDSDSGYTRDWWFKVKGSKFWKFTLNGNDVYDQIPVDASGNKYKQWMLAKYVNDTPWASGMFSFGKGEKVNCRNQADTQNITSFNDCLVINVNGNGEGPETIEGSDVYYPDDSDIQNSGMRIEYINANDGVYSSADSSVNNYLVFSGKITMTIPNSKTGPYGFFSVSPIELYNEYTKYANEGRSGYHYVDDKVFQRKFNTYQTLKSWLYTNDYERSSIIRKTVGSADNDDGRYYSNYFYNTERPTYSPAKTYTEIFLAPPDANEGDLSKRFKYDLNGKYSYYAQNGGYDIIPYVDILACTLQIGDKYCVETVVNGKKHFEWYTEQELKNMNMYTADSSGNVIYNAFIYLAVNIDDGQYLIGESHDIYNNISTDMGLDKTGMAIPLPSNEHLSGELHFAIVGVVNSVWDNGVRRHPTWSRHTTYTANPTRIMTHVDKIYIEKFDVALVSDNGKAVINDDNDIVYMSDEVQKYMIKKDDLEFKFNTALTASEANAMGVAPILSKSTVVNITTGDAILGIVNNMTSETDKPEKHYVDAYWREYNTPRMMFETSLHDTYDMEHLDGVQFKKFTFPYIDDKTFFVTKTERNLKNETINLTLKERND